MSIQSSCPFVKFDNFLFFVFLLLSYLNFLNILAFKPLSDRWFANEFPTFHRCIFSMLLVSFVVQKLSVWCCLTIPYLFLFSFIAYAFGVRPKKKIKKSLPRRISRSFNPLFSSSRLTTADLMLKYFIHFELIFICLKVFF